MFLLQTSPMQFYYRIYQKTKVLTRRRKKRRSKTGSRNQPARKKRHMDTSFTPTQPAMDNKMEVVSEPQAPKLSAKLEKSGKEQLGSKLRIAAPKDTVPDDKKSKPNISPVTKVTKKVSNPNSQEPLKSAKKTAKLDSTGPTSASKPKSVCPKKNISSPTVTTKPVPMKKGTAPVESSEVTRSVAPVLLPQTLTKSPSSQKKPTEPLTPVSVKSKEPVTQAPVKSAPKPQTSVSKIQKEKSVINAKPISCKSPAVEASKDNAVKPTAAAMVAKLPAVAAKLPTVDKSPNKLVIAEKKPASEKEVVEISVEVSASDVKKVLEKKRAEKDAKLMTSGEDKLYSNYSIVDQIKKAGSSAANLARQQTERASMMDYARTNEALNSPKVPPTIQGLQPKVSGSDSNVLSAIVQSLAQKQQKQLQSGYHGSPDQGPPRGIQENVAKLTESETFKQSADATKTLGTMVAPTLASTKISQEPKQQQNKQPTTPKLPVSTSINPVVSRDGKQSPKAVETSGAIGQQMLNFYKNSFSKTNSLSDAAKSAETLTKNIPAGTTVTVKTVDNKPNGKSSPNPSTSSPAPSPPAPFVNNLSTTKTLANPFSSISAPVSQSPLINPLLQSSLRDSMNMALAAQQAQYLNFNNPQFGAAAALAAAQMEAANYVQAANIMRAAQAVSQISSQPPVTTLEFTKPNQASQDPARFGLKIPTPTLNRSHTPTVSSFGTSKLQVKVNSDTNVDSLKANTSNFNKSARPSPPTSSEFSGKAIPSNGKAAGTHSMPAILPFHSAKKVQALPKSTVYSSRPSPVQTMLKVQSNPKVSPTPPAIGSTGNANSVQSLTDSNPFKSSVPVKPGSPGVKSLNKSSMASPPTSINNPFKPVTQSQVNSLKKLAAGLTSAQEKVLKGDNILSALKKNNSDKKLADLKGYGLENKNGSDGGGGGKEVTSS